MWLRGDLPLYIFLSKILPLMVLPLGMVVATNFLALVLLWAGRRKSAVSALFLALLVLWVSSMPITAGTLYSSLVRGFLPVPLSEVPVRECIVLLGGAVSPAVPPRVDIELNEAVDRVYKAAQLFRNGKAPVVIVSAGNLPWKASVQVEAEVIQTLLVEWGVPLSAIVLERASRNTRENATNSKELIEQMSCQKPLLVTSASHLPRAVAAFEKVGVPVFPVSTDLRSVPAGYTALDFLPQAGALAMTTDVMREWIGRWVYKFRDWN